MAKRIYSDYSPTIFRKVIFHEIILKSFSQGFLLISNFPTIVRKLTKNFLEKLAREFYQKHFPEFDNLPKFSENFETILLNVRFQFCFALSCPMISQSNCEKAGQDE